MRVNNALAAVLFSSSLASAAPFNFPTPDGFPNPSDDSVKQIQVTAQGTLPNGPPPANVSAEGLTNLKLIAFNEIFEVAFFTELLSNITNKVPGYDIGAERYDENYIVKTLQAVIAQEELHALNANGALKHFGAAPIEPCTYQFPVSNFQDAINIARTATDVVLGTLQDVEQIFAQGGDAGLVRAVASVIGQEGEQNGFYRLVLGQIPSELPFLTTSDRNFAFTAIQSFVVPGSCPNLDTIPLTTFQGLTAASQPVGTEDQEIGFSFDGTKVAEGESVWVTYINQQNAPITVEVSSGDAKSGSVTASFPLKTNLLNGLTIATVTKSQGPFANASEVADATVFGPAFLFAN